MPLNTEQVLIDYRPDLFYPPRSGVWIAGKITFIPGVKAYPLADWKLLQSNAVVLYCVAEGILRVESQSPKTMQGGEPEVPPLPKSQAEAIALIKRTFSLSLLNAWQKVETRKPVQAAITKQISVDTPGANVPAPEAPVIILDPPEESEEKK